MHEGLITRVIRTETIEGADRIIRADVGIDGVSVASVVTGVDTGVGKLGILFMPDTQLSTEFCEANDLLIRYDENGKRVGGYLEPDKRRIKAQRFKGVRSEGLWLPLSCLAYTYPPQATETDISLFYDRYAEGDKVSESNGHAIARRYPKPEPRVNTIGSTSTKRTRYVYFPEHYDTDQLLHNLKEVERIPVGANIYITEKLHGTSHRVGYVSVTTIERHEVPLTRLQRAVNWFLKPLGKGYTPAIEERTYRTYRHVHGTRRTTVEDGKEGYYGSNQFRLDAVGSPLLEQDEMIYGELVGYAGQTPIMPSHDIKGFKEVKQYAKDGKVHYTYGTVPGQAEFYVYRITRLVNGIETDLPFFAMMERARELGYKVVPYLYSYQYDGSVEELVKTVTQVAESRGIYRLSTLDNHPAEGVVVRIEYNGRQWVYKYKSFLFRAMEGIITVDDPEDNQ